MKKTVILLALIVILSTYVSADDAYDERVAAELVNDLIPVEEPVLSGDTVSIAYDISFSYDNRTFPSDAMFILGRLAKEYPEAEYAEVVGMSGENRVISISAKRSVIEDYAMMRIWEDDFKNSLTIKEYVSDCPQGQIKTNGACAAQAAEDTGSGKEATGETSNMLFLGIGIAGALMIAFGLLGILAVVAYLLFKKK